MTIQMILFLFNRSSFAIQRLTEILLGLVFIKEAGCSASISSVSKCEGDAQIVFATGKEKTRLGFDAGAEMDRYCSGLAVFSLLDILCCLLVGFFQFIPFSIPFFALLCVCSSSWR